MEELPAEQEVDLKQLANDFINIVELLCVDYGDEETEDDFVEVELRPGDRWALGYYEVSKDDKNIDLVFVDKESLDFVYCVSVQITQSEGGLKEYEISLYHFIGDNCVEIHYLDDRLEPNPLKNFRFSSDNMPARGVPEPYASNFLKDTKILVEELRRLKSEGKLLHIGEEGFYVPKANG